VPGVAVVAVLRNPNNASAETQVQALQAAARAMGIELRFVSAEFVVNLKTAKSLGLAFPLPLTGRADEMIE
jgi:ABC-type uncharacterized transport system substrate-binding protein